MKCVACGKERKIYDTNVCKKCYDNHYKILREGTFDEIQEIEDIRK